MAATSPALKRKPAADHRQSAKPPSPSMIVIGKDVLELLSSAMYVDPLSIFREYVQNAADAIDEARDHNFLGKREAGRVDIQLDGEARRIIIRDNGAGIPIDQAPSRLLAIGSSPKRGTRARGFRGVGRLAGLAYGRSLTFRTRSAGDDEVIEIHWDCQRLKTALRDVEQRDDISSVIQRVVTIRTLSGRGWPKHFFEVELADVIRTKRDALLSEAAVADYLAQVAPVPFAGDFQWVDAIAKHLAPVRLADLDIRIGERASLTRPFHNSFKVSDAVDDQFSEIELLTFTDLDGGTAGVGWVLHHRYLGSITVRAQVGGLRLRVGNVQIGAADLMEDFFPETRFNGWAVGELHVLDPRILPNARRDDFEQNVHYSNLTAQLEPVARQIARRARSASITRNRARRAELEAERAQPAPSPARGPVEQHGVEPVVDAAAQTSAALAADDAHAPLVAELCALLNRSGIAPADQLLVLQKAIAQLGD